MEGVGHKRGTGWLQEFDVPPPVAIHCPQLIAQSGNPHTAHFFKMD
jgi:hypothetical protein